jgi:small-conductance mechanosensitive channel
MVRPDTRVVNKLALAVAVLVVVLCLAIIPSAAQDQAASQPPSPPQNPGYPVSVDGSEILRIFESVGSFTAQDRAKAISARLQKLVNDPAADVNQIKIVETAYSTSLELGDNVLLVVTDNDARHLQVSRSVVAAYYLKQIRQGITIARLQHSKEFLIWAGIYAVLTLAIYLFLVWVVVVAFRRLLKGLQPAVAHMKGITIQQSELLEGRRLAEMVGGALRAIRVALIVGLTWIFLAREFTYFPWTREHGRRLLEYITTPLLFVFHGFINYLPNVFYILVIVTVMVYVMKFVRLIAREVERGNIRIPGFYPEWVPPTYKILRFSLIAFTAVMIYPYLPGEGSPAFKGIGLFIGVLFSLGSTSAVANAIAGIIIIYARGFRVGDWVKIGDNTGGITAMTMLATHLQTIRNEEIMVPNSVVLSNYVTNYSMLARTQGLALHTSVTIGYEAPWRQVHGLLLDAARKTKHVLEQPAPFVLQNALQDSYVQYEINVYTDKPELMVYIYSELHGNIQDCFFAAGVEIMSPVYSALRDGNQTQMPAEFLPAGYRPRGFRISKDDAAAAASGRKP